MPKFIWKTEFTVEPQLGRSESVGDYFFEVRKSGETIVERVHETSSYDEVHRERRHNCEYAEETFSRLDAEEIREIILKRMIYHRVFLPVSVKLMASPVLVNKNDLESIGVELRRPVGTSLTLRNAILDVGDSLAESEHFWNSAFQANAIGQKNEIIRLADWVERSVRETDPVKSFILSWIGFNGLYNLFALRHSITRSSDADKFDFMISQLIGASQADEIIRGIKNEIKKLGTYSITSDSGNTNWSSKLTAETRRPAMNNLEVLKLVAKCIYGVRKQVFHEAPKTNDVLERVEISNAALMPISLMCLKAFITH
jgi:hypothetical protein